MAPAWLATGAGEEELAPRRARYDRRVRAMLCSCTFAAAVAGALASMGCPTRGRVDRASGAPLDDAGVPAPVTDPSLGLSVPPPSPAASGPFFIADPTVKVVPIRRADAPNIHYASLDRATCEAELTRRGAQFVVAEAVAGVMAPVRLRGPLHGVSIHSDRAPKDRERSVYDVFDCRLALALDDFSQLLAQRDVTELIFFAAYRPKSEHGCTARYWGLQHCAALAVDVRELRHRDGTTLNVERDFHGHIGVGTCANGTGPSPKAPVADELWSFVCEAANRALFHVMLTPNYNAEHKNHFHLEITPEANWMMIK